MNPRWLREAPFDQARREGKRHRKLPICRWCGRGVAPPRKAWCGPQCVHEFEIRRSPRSLRKAVFRRDHGRCAACGLDTMELKRERFVRALVGKTKGTSRSVKLRRRAALKAWRARLHELGFDPRRSPWQADHIVPVCEGGGACGLEGIQTLCQPCHREKTREDMQRRAAQKADQE